MCPEDKPLAVFYTAINALLAENNKSKPLTEWIMKFSQVRPLL
jgi:hypothetical protein